MKQNILIADSGSTKTDWAYNGQCLQTQGINPFHMDDDTIRVILQKELLPQLNDDSHADSISPVGPMPSAIFFYGSGVRPECEERMQQLLHETFPSAIRIEAKSDLLGAARALCGRDEGIACILGTGANSCLFDGEKIVQNIPALGYILGDEGSGANLGLRFLNALYKNLLPCNIKEEFEESMNITLPVIIQRVYREPMPNRFLASLSPFIHDHLDDPSVEALVKDGFREFLRKNVNAYRRRDLPVSAVGSIVFYYKNQWSQTLKEEGFLQGKIIKSPIEGLMNF